MLSSPSDAVEDADDIGGGVTFGFEVMIVISRYIRSSI